jgi:hypothetical protein
MRNSFMMRKILFWGGPEIGFVEKSACGDFRAFPTTGLFSIFGCYGAV